MMADDTDWRLQAWERGLRLRTRGACWELLDFERGDGCTALHLSAEDSRRTATLLSPFDRCRRLAAALPVEVSPRDWIREAGALAAAAHPAGGLAGRALAGIQLHAYQLEPALAVIRHGATRVLVADAVGLGKTIQAGLLIAELTVRSPALRTLVLVPAGLRDQWALELRRLFDLPAVPADAAWLRRTARDRPGSNPWALPGIYLASQDFVKRPEVLRPLEEIAWDLVVIDEAHTCSARTDRRMAAHAIASRASRVVLLTATPHADDPAEFAALCALGRVDPGDAGIVVFQRSREEVVAAVPRRSTLLAVRPSDAELRMHELLERYTAAVWRESRARGDDVAPLAATVLRKRALSSAASLVVSVRRRLGLLMGEAAPAREQLRLPLDDEEPLDDVAPSAILGAPGLAHAAAERRWLSAIAEAGRRASQAETKTRFLRRLLGRVREPAIVFTEFRDTLLRLAAALASTGRPVLLLHGGVAPGERSRIQQAFNQADALLLATDAAAEGLNLHARCRIVVHYELPWSAIRLEQRAGRVDRFGQTRRVHEIALVAASTAERMVLAPLLRRVGLARSVRPGAAGLAATLTESRVAETIIGQVPFPSAAPAPPSVGTRSIPAGADAAEEVARLTDIRTLPVSAARRRQVPLASLACTRPFVPGLIVVFLISLTTASGRLVHVEPATLFLPLAGRNARRGRPRLLRALVATLARPGSAMIGPSIGRALQSAVDRASLVHRRVEEALERRHAARDRLRASAARHLVQSGLFERAPRNALSPGTGTLDASSAATPDAGHRILGVDVRLAAALHVRRR